MTSNNLDVSKLQNNEALNNKGYSEEFISENMPLIKNIANKMEMEYTLVSEEEANLKEKKISVSSPIGKGLLGKEVGDIAEIKVPAGLLKLEVINISR